MLGREQRVLSFAGEIADPDYYFAHSVVDCRKNEDLRCPLILDLLTTGSQLQAASDRWGLRLKSLFKERVLRLGLSPLGQFSWSRE